MRNINLESVVYFQNSVWKVSKILSLSRIEISNENEQNKGVEIKDVKLVSSIKSEYGELMEIDSQDWEIAKNRLNIIREIIYTKCSSKIIDKISNENNISQATIYRWKEKYESSNGILTSLLPTKRNGGKGQSRLTEKQELILLRIINEHYLTPQRKTVTKVYEELQLLCRDKKTQCPSLNTLRNRILSLSENILVSTREGKRAHNEKFNPKTGSFPNGNYPLETVQIDHTPVDLIVIDDETGIPLGRPWLTLAIDVYSRMITGYNLGFDAPSILTTGICISNSILPKDKILKKFNIQTEWPAWGIMNTIHTDNGIDFRSEAISRACSQYGIEIDFRPMGLPEYGGHIERLMGTFSKEFHSLKGTTFNKVVNRRKYNSEEKAVFTLEMLEEYVVTFITEVYNQKKHSGIGTSPIMKYKQGIWGNDYTLGTGTPSIVDDEKKLKLDFLPYFERSIQNYGVSIDKVFYYSEVLRPFIHKTQFTNKNGIKREKVKYTFRRDPRDISVLYFWDPEVKIYYEIPYANMSHPKISLWDLKAIRRKLKLNEDQIDEDLIFDALKKLRQLEDKATKNKKTLRKKIKNNDVISTNSSSVKPNFNDFDDVDFDNIKPF